MSLQLTPVFTRAPRELYGVESSCSCMHYVDVKYACPGNEFIGFECVYTVHQFLKAVKQSYTKLY